MKVIELLNKIANGEEVPSKIKWNDFIYEKSKYNATPMGYYHRTNGDIKLWFLNDINDLNDEVEIIGEDKKIKTIDPIDYCHSTDTSKDMVLVEKINEIIRFLYKTEKDK